MSAEKSFIEKVKDWCKQFVADAESPFTKKGAISYSMVLIGSCMFALADFLFVVPYGLAPGGVYGLMSVFNNLWDWPMKNVIFMDLPLFIIGLIFLGSNFGIKTLLSILFTWLFTWAIESYGYIATFGYIPLIHSGEYITPEVFATLGTQVQEMYLPVRALGGGIIEYFKPDYILNTVVGGLVYGVSISIIFYTGATSGGSDIISMIIHKYAHIPLGTMVIIVDSIIALTSFAIGGDIRIPIFSIIFIYLEGIVINKIVTVNKYQTLLIITDNVEGMRDLILKELERSGTIFTGKGLYHNVERNMIYTTVNKKEYNVIKFAAKKLDPNCFITIISNTETLGEGFQPLPEK